MNIMWRKGFLAAAALGLIGTMVQPGPAAAKELSDKSVKVLMNYAWAILPSKFTMPDRRVVEVDKKNKRKETEVPLDVAREIIKVGYNSAQAQLCEMWEDQTRNYDAMIRIQRAKHNWNDPQLLYITTLHRMAVHMTAGKLNVVEKKGELQVSLDPIEPDKSKCDAARQKKIKDIVDAQVAEALKIAPPKKKAASAPAAASGVVPAAQKK